MPLTKYLCEVRSFKMLTPTVFELAFTPDQTMHFKAGQFCSIIIPGAGPNGKDLRRSYSIASPPHYDPVELCIKIVEEGPGTQFLSKLRPGDKFSAFAPYGIFVYVSPPERHVCFIATGTGVAPFRSMILSEEFQARRPKSATCLFGVRDQSELLYVDDAKAHPEVKTVPALSRPKPGWNGFTGRVTDYMRSLGEDYPWKETDYYLCGNGSMITEVKQLLLETRGVDKKAIHQEIYYKE